MMPEKKLTENMLSASASAMNLSLGNHSRHSLTLSNTSPRVTELPCMRLSGMWTAKTTIAHKHKPDTRMYSPANDASEKQTNGNDWNAKPPIDMVAKPRGMPTMAHTFVACPSGVIEVSKLDSNVPIAMPPMK